MRIPENPEIFQERRKTLSQNLKENEALILFSKTLFYRQPDIAFPYRQDSFFYYLTGLEEPESCLILKKTFPQSILFVQKNTEEKQLWEGEVFGAKRASSTLLVDEAFHIDELKKVFSNLLSKNFEHIYRISGINTEFDQKLEKMVEELQGSKLKFLDFSPYISNKRMIKSNYEIRQIRKACEVSTKAHEEVMKACHPSISERKLHGVFIESIMSQNAERESYPGIFAGGKNALVLHYTDNNQICKDGELILVDAGAEWNYYASDITRTFPVSGQFSESQKIIYNETLHIQKTLISMVKPGVTLLSLQNKTLEMMFNCLKKHSLLKSDKKSEVKKFYPHNFGHLLGLDVHDVKHIEENEKSLTLKEGMVLTVEPGIYIPKDDPSIPEKFRGIAVRIEDNVLVKVQGSEVLSKNLVKEVQEIEKLMAQNRK